MTIGGIELIYRHGLMALELTDAIHDKQALIPDELWSAIGAIVRGEVEGETYDRIRRMMNAPMEK